MTEALELALLAGLAAFVAAVLGRELGRRSGAHAGAHPGAHPGALRELQAGAADVLQGAAGKLRSLAGLGWLTRLLGKGDLSSTRFVFLGAFGVASFLLGLLFTAITVRFLRTGATDASICVLAAGSLGTFLGFATNSQNTKHKADAQPTDPQQDQPR